ncbi:MAG: DEAD/DEAH box helicase [Desulfamplus sp.]|nr:DEAD/DEAH box helicase [Desulfamplus sp.]
MSLAEYIDSLKKYKKLAPDIVCHRTVSPKKGMYASWPDTISGKTREVFEKTGIKRLYLHQKKAMEMILEGIHTVVATPTASGKSLIYNLPVVERLFDNPESRALYLFPLKALARDQFSTIKGILDIAATVNKSIAGTVNKNSAVPGLIEAEFFTAAVYDGDVSNHARGKIRLNPPNVLLSNPEMLHLSMLAHHHLWKTFFANLKFVVVDEVHTYRGVTGSHMAWVFRRLLRICRFYGAEPVFVFCSATIDNPKELASELTGLEVEIVDSSSAPAGKKEIILMNGMAGAAQTAIQLVHASVHRELRTIVYTQSRKITELIAMWASERAGRLAPKISAYRAGFLPDERRDIEIKLSSGELLCVVSTSALELGIDIGNLDICILVGYPGSIMSTWQRAGRVGRDGKDSAMIFIAHEDALDYYFMNNPEQFFAMPPEKAVINPYNDIIMARHLGCAASDLALMEDEELLQNRLVRDAVKALESNAILLRSSDGRNWYASKKYPHREVGLRGSGNTIPIFIENTRQPLGDIDWYRSFFETHEGAVYLHSGETFIVNKLDLERQSVQVVREDVSYYTRARSDKSTQILEIIDKQSIWNTEVGFGRLMVTTRVTGYERKMVHDQKSMGIIPLELPPITFETQGLWIEVPETVREHMESDNLHFMGGLHAVEHAIIGILPLLVMADRNDFGGISIPWHPQTGKASVFIYDGVPGGIGLSRKAFVECSIMLEKTLNVISSCRCETGCPGCVHSPKCGSGNRPIDKSAALGMLENMRQLKTGLSSLKNKEKKIEPSSPDKKEEYLLPKQDDSLAVKEIAAPFAKTFIAGIKSRNDTVISNFNEGKSRFAQARSEFDAAKDKFLPVTNKFVATSEKPLRFAVLDLETRRSAQEVGGWNRADKMGVSCVVLYDSATDEYIEYLQDDIPELELRLQYFDLVIGFNIINFDYRVLAGLSDFDFYSLPTLDLLAKVHKTLGYRLSLDKLATHTLGTKKSADGLLALKWWKEGKVRQIIDYCIQDVRVTKDLYLFGKENHYLMFENKAGKQVRLPVKW